jgi:hypothetical protein
MKLVKEIMKGFALKFSDQTSTEMIVALERAGFVIVPKIPTPSMLTAARDWSQSKYGKPVGNDGATGCWNAMIDAFAGEK